MNTTCRVTPNDSTNSKKCYFYDDSVNSQHVELYCPFPAMISVILPYDVIDCAMVPTLKKN